VSVSPGGGTAIAISSSGSWFIRVFLFSLPKEKERGNKGRAIYRAVGSQVTYATHIAPTAYALRVTLFTTSTCTDTLFVGYTLEF